MRAMNKRFRSCMPFNLIIKYQQIFGISGAILWMQVYKFTYVNHMLAINELKEIKKTLKYDLRVLKRKRNELKIIIGNGFSGRNKRSKQSREDSTFKSLDICEDRIKNIEKLNASGRKEYLETYIENSQLDKLRLDSMLPPNWQKNI